MNYSDIFQVYSEPCVTLTYSERWYIQSSDMFRTRGIFRTLVFTEAWYIQKPGIFRTLLYSEPEVYSELCQTSTMERFPKKVDDSMSIIIFANYKYFRNISFLGSLLCRITQQTYQINNNK